MRNRSVPLFCLLSLSFAPVAFSQSAPVSPPLEAAADPAQTTERAQAADPAAKDVSARADRPSNSPQAGSAMADRKESVAAAGGSSTKRVLLIGAVVLAVAALAILIGSGGGGGSGGGY